MKPPSAPPLSPKSKNNLGEVIELENFVDGQCVRHIHLISNDPLRLKPLSPKFGLPPNLGEECIMKEAGVWHLRAVYPFRGVVDIHSSQWVKFRRVVAWNLEGCASVREAIGQASMEFERLFHSKPKFVFMNKLPKGVEMFQDVDGMMLLEAEWMLERCVAVGCKTPLSTPLSASTLTSPQMDPSTALRYAQDNLGGENGA